MLAIGLTSSSRSLSLGNGARPADKRGSLGPRDGRTTSLTGSGTTTGGGGGGAGVAAALWIALALSARQ